MIHLGCHSRHAERKLISSQQHYVISHKRCLKKKKKYELNFTIFKTNHDGALAYSFVVA